MEDNWIKLLSKGIATDKRTSLLSSPQEDHALDNKILLVWA